jgi:hypothetical protein
MSKTFLTDKDHIINELDDSYKLELTDEEYDHLRKLTNSQLLLVAAIMARATRKAKET